MEKEQWQEKGQGHRQRLRDRFLERGLENFTDAEVLELLLTFGTPRSDCKEAARTALKEFDSLAAVLEAPLQALQKIKGIGPKNGFAIHFVQATARRYLAARLKGKRYLHSSGDVRDFLVHSLRGLKKEVFQVIFLDTAHAIIDTRTVAEGTINVNTIYPRELLHQALELNAAALILAHNHPSGNLQPSSQDLQLTRSLCLIGSFMHIQILDHLIIGDGCYSMADQGLMEDLRQDAVRAAETLR